MATSIPQIVLTPVNNSGTIKREHARFNIRKQKHLAMKQDPNSISVKMRENGRQRGQVLIFLENNIAVSMIQVEDHQEIAVVRMSKGDVDKCLTDSVRFNNFAQVLEHIEQAERFIEDAELLNSFRLWQ